MSDEFNIPTPKDLRKAKEAQAAETRKLAIPTLKAIGVFMRETTPAVDGCFYFDLPTEVRPGTMVYDEIVQKLYNQQWNAEHWTGARHDEHKLKITPQAIPD